MPLLNQTETSYIRSIKLTENVSEGRFVTRLGAYPTGDGQNCLGSSLYSGVTGDVIDVGCNYGSDSIQLGATLVAGAEITCENGTGKAIAASTNNIVLGILVSGGDADEIVEFRHVKYQKSA